MCRETLFPSEVAVALFWSGILSVSLLTTEDLRDKERGGKLEDP